MTEQCESKVEKLDKNCVTDVPKCPKNGLNMVKNSQRSRCNLTSYNINNVKVFKKGQNIHHENFEKYKFKNILMKVIFQCVQFIKLGNEFSKMQIKCRITCSSTTQKNWRFFFVVHPLKNRVEKKIKPFIFVTNGNCFFGTKKMHWNEFWLRGAT